MGQDKALIPFLGQPLVQRVIDRLSPIADEILVTTNTPEEYQFLQLPCYEDILPDRGALGGLYTALEAASHPLVAVVGCDMPFANRFLLEHCSQLLEETGADVAIPQTDHGLEPMHTVYRKNKCLPAVKTAIDQDKWKLIAFHNAVEVRVIPPEVIRQFDPEGLVFLNVNTPEEWEQAETLAKELD